MYDGEGYDGGGGGGRGYSAVDILYHRDQEGNDKGKGKKKRKEKKGAKGAGKNGKKGSFAKRAFGREGPKKGNLSNHLPDHLGGGKICGAFNGKRGCVRRESDCPSNGSHVCGYVVDHEGTPCAKKNCSFTYHNKGGW